MIEKNYITPKGAQKLKQELKELLDVERPKVVQTVSWAASNGDRSENGDYIYGKRRLREIDRRIRFLTKRLESAVVINPLEQRKDRIFFGATVTILDQDNKERTYSIVGIDEANASLKRISWISPLGKALLNAKVGDVVSYRIPSKEENTEDEDLEEVEIEILRVEYREID